MTDFMTVDTAGSDAARLHHVSWPEHHIHIPDTVYLWNSMGTGATIISNGEQWRVLGGKHLFRLQSGPSEPLFQTGVNLDGE